MQTARSMRPPLMTSRLAHWMANRIGSRMTNVDRHPTWSRTRRVLAASAPSSATTSIRGFSRRLSPTLMPSKYPDRSAASAAPRRSSTPRKPSSTPRLGRLRLTLDRPGFTPIVRPAASPSADDRRRPEVVHEAEAVRREGQVSDVRLPEDDLADVIEGHNADVRQHEELLHVTELLEQFRAARLAIRDRQAFLVGWARVPGEVREWRLCVEQREQVVVRVRHVGGPPRHPCEHVGLPEVLAPLRDVQQLHLDLHPQIVLEHRRDDLRGQPWSESAWVRAQHERRQSLPAWEAGLRQ